MSPVISQIALTLHLSECRCTLLTKAGLLPVLCVAVNVTPQFLEETLETFILSHPCLIPSQVLVTPCPLLILHASFRSPEAPLLPMGFWELSPKASLHPQLPQHNLLCIKTQNHHWKLQKCQSFQEVHSPNTKQ